MGRAKPPGGIKARIVWWLARLSFIMLLFTLVLTIALAVFYHLRFPDCDIPFSDAKTNRAIHQLLAGDTVRCQKMAALLPKLDRLQTAVNKGVSDPLIATLAPQIKQDWPQIVAVAGWEHKKAGTAAGGCPWDFRFFADLLYEKIDTGDCPWPKPDESPALSYKFPLNESTFVSLSEPRSLGNDLFAVYVYTGGVVPAAMPSDQATLYTIIVYFPWRDTLLLLVNLFYLSVFLSIITWFLQRRWVPSLLLLCGAILNIIVHYDMFFVPRLTMLTGLGDVRIALKSLVWMNLAADFLFDVPLFILAGFCMIKQEDCRSIKRLYVWLIIIATFLANYSMNFLDIQHQLALLSGTVKDLFAPGGFCWADFLPYAYGSAGLLFMAVSVNRTCRAETGAGAVPFPISMHLVAWVVPLLLGSWAASQILYVWRNEIPFFTIVFAAKAIALTGFVFFLYTREVIASLSEQDTIRREAQIEIMNRSLEIFVRFDEHLKIQWCSERATSLLGPIDRGTPLEAVFTDERDYNWLLHKIIIPSKQWERFELHLKDYKGQRITCQADYVPKWVGHEFDLLIARPIDSVLMAALGQRFHIHGLKGTINTCRTWLQQLVDDLKDYHGVPTATSLPTVEGVRGNLKLLSEAVQPESVLVVDLNEPTVANLNRVLEDIDATAQDDKRWPELQVSMQIPEARLNVRAKERILTLILKELLDNAVKKGDKSGSGKAANATIETVVDQDFVTIEISDDGSPLPQDVLQRFEQEQYRLVPGTQLSLQRIRFYAVYFGGDFCIENKKVTAEGTTVECPTFTLKLWRLE